MQIIPDAACRRLRSVSRAFLSHSFRQHLHLEMVGPTSAALTPAHHCGNLRSLYSWWTAVAIMDPSLGLRHPF